MTDPTSSAMPPSAAPAERDLSGEKNTLLILYVMHGLSPFTLWILAIVAMIVGLLKRGDVTGTWLDSHYDWLSRTFWFGLLWGALAWLTFWVLGLLTLGIGMIVLWILPLSVLIWYLYRVIYGAIKLSENRHIGR